MYVYVSVLCTNLPQILYLLFCLTIHVHLFNLWSYLADACGGVPWRGSSEDDSVRVARPPAAHRDLWWGIHT